MSPEEILTAAAYTPEQIASWNGQLIERLMTGQHKRDVEAEVLYTYLTDNVNLTEDQLDTLDRVFFGGEGQA